jgi:hypothetical protein
MFAKLAKSLVKKLGAKDEEAAVHCVLSEIKCFVEPVQACLDFFLIAQRISLSRGDIYYACTNRLQHTINCFWSGLNLDVVNKTLDDAQLFFEKQGQESSLLFVTIMQRTVRILMGTTDLNSSPRLQQIPERKMPRQACQLAFHNLYISFLFRDRDLQEHCTNFLELEARMQKPFLVFMHSVWAFIVGLASFQVCKQHVCIIMLSYFQYLPNLIVSDIQGEWAWTVVARTRQISKTTQTTLGR